MTPVPRPPRFTRWLLRRALPAGGASGSIEADLHEEFRQRHAESPARARAWYRAEVRSLVARYGVARQGASMMDTFWHDVRQAARSLAGARAFTLTAVATLSIGIGAAVAVFALVDAVLIRPLPFTDPDRLIWARQIMTRTGSEMSLSWPDTLDWQQQNTVFDDMAATKRTTETLTGTGDATRVDGREVTWSFLRVLGVQPAIGRDFLKTDYDAGTRGLVLISDNLWRARFGADPSVPGRLITFNGLPHTILGVLPAGFQYFAAAEFLELKSPGTATATETDRANHVGLSVVGRLKPGLTLVDARRDLSAIAANIERSYPASNSGTGAVAVTLTSAIIGDVTPTLRALFGAVAALLLLACASIANLLVARGTARAHELSVRAALGCGRGRLVRQLMAESLLLAAAGGIAGIVIGAGLLRVLVSLIPPQTPRLLEVAFGPGVVAFALGSTAVCALIFGVLPAITGSGARAQEALIRASRSGQGTSQLIRRGLLIVEIALALVLLVGAGLVGQSMRKIFAVDPGFDPSNVVSMRMALQGEQWTPERQLELYDRLLTRARQVPGVEAAALAQSVPLAGAEWGSVFVVGDRPVPPPSDIPNAAFSIVSDSFLAALGLRLERGRFFNASDTLAAPPVTVINARMAAKIWPGENPIGKRFKQGFPDNPGPWREVIGVVSDVKLNGVSQDSPLEAYLPITQTPTPRFALIARAKSSTQAIVAPLRTIVREIDPNLPMFQVQTMNELLGTETSWQRVSVVVIGAFGVFAVLVACIGLYGIVSHTITERRQEIGIRLALGATAKRIVASFVSQSLKTAAIGTAAGLVIAWFTARLLDQVLFQTKARDAVTFASVSVLLLTITLIASYLPARRAAKVSPTTALRGE